MAGESIQKELDGKEAIQTIRFFLQRPDRTAIVVESDDDVRLYGKFTAKNTHIQKSKAGGWIEILKVLNACQDKRVIGIRDSDFTGFLSVDEGMMNMRMFHTAYHDAEMMIVSANWESIFHEYLGYTGHDKDELLKKIFESLIPISCLKFQNERDGLTLHFEGIRLANFFDGKTLAFDMPGYLVGLNKKSKNKTKNILEKDIESLETIIHLNVCSRKMESLYKQDPVKFFWCFVNGHDFLQCCSVCARQHHDTNDVNDRQMARSARTAYSMDKFSKTDLYKSIIEYSNKTSLSFWKDANQ